jgi:hypothetical protein
LLEVPLEVAQEAEGDSYFGSYSMPVETSRRLPAGLIVKVEAHLVMVAEQLVSQTHFVEKVAKLRYCY